MASRFHRIPTHFLLNLHGLSWKLASYLWPSLTWELLPQVIECDILKRLGLPVLLAYLRGEGVHTIRSQARKAARRYCMLSAIY